MPKRIAHEAGEREAIVEALEAIRRNAPSNTKLAIKASRGTLALNLNTVELESGVTRHRIITLYPDLAVEIAASTAERRQAEPLRKQLDDSRRKKALAERRLDQARAYSYRLLERISQLGREKKQLEERIEELEKDIDTNVDEELIGKGEVVGVPFAGGARKRKRMRYEVN